MKFPQKIEFLQESLKLNDKQFASKYHIKLSLLKRWKTGEEKPNKDTVSSICKDFNLDVVDFLDEKSTLAEPLKGEHPCATVARADSSNVIYEDFAREDNSRYEEKD